MGWSFNPFTGKFDYFDKYTDAEAKAAAIAGWTASRALQVSAGGNIEASPVTLAELNYLDGVTAAIQGQIDDNKILALLGVK